MSKTTSNHQSQDPDNLKVDKDKDFTLEEVEVMFGRGKRVLQRLMSPQKKAAVQH